MKTKFYTLALCALTLCTFFGCKGKEKENEPESIIGSVEKPTWTAPADYDLTSSMTAVVKADLSAIYTAEQLSAANYQVSENDIVAAFSGEECLGVAGPLSPGEGQGEVFFLYICAPTNGGQVTLRYYSAALKNIFTSEPFPFANDTQLGTIETPYMPQFAIE